MRNVRQKFGYVLVTLLCLLGANMANAGLAIYSCTHPIYGVNGSGGYGTQFTSGACVGNHTANQSSTLVTSNAVLQAAAYQVADIIHTRLNQLRNPNMQRLASAESLLGSGVSTGDTFTNFSVWANGSWNRIKNDFSSTAFDGHIATAMVGVDTTLEDYHTIVGLALGWEDQDFSTHFNRGQQDATGWSLTPYASVMFDPNWSATVYAGYAWLDYDLTRSDPATWGAIVGDADASRWYLGGDLNLHINNDPVRFNGYMGLLHISEKRDDYGETGAQVAHQGSHTTDLTRFRLGASMGYMLHKMVEPYVKAALLWDMDHTDITVAAVQARPQDSSTALVAGGGFNFFLMPNMFINIEGYSEVFRDNYDKYGITGNILFTFG